MSCRISAGRKYGELVSAASLVELGVCEDVAAVQVRSRALRVSLYRSIVPRHGLRNPPLFSSPFPSSIKATAEFRNTIDVLSSICAVAWSLRAILDISHPLSLLIGCVVRDAGNKDSRGKRSGHGPSLRISLNYLDRKSARYFAG